MNIPIVSRLVGRSKAWPHAMRRAATPTQAKGGDKPGEPGPRPYEDVRNGKYSEAKWSKAPLYKEGMDAVVSSSADRSARSPLGRPLVRQQL